MQTPVVCLVLSKMGCNQHMPQAVEFGSILKCGIGLLDLYSEQGAQQIKLLISHLQSKSYLHNPIQILLESVQVAAGILDSPLQDTQQLVYVNSPWLQSIREYFHSINATIHISNLATISKSRQHDLSIMQNIHQMQYTKTEQELINFCRLYLRAMTLLEVTKNKGDRFISCAVTGSVTEISPTFWSYSVSKLT
jgi:hypothetical protein